MSTKTQSAFQYVGKRPQDFTVALASLRKPAQLNHHSSINLVLLPRQIKRFTPIVMYKNGKRVPCYSI